MRLEELTLHPKSKVVVEAIIERPPQALIIDGQSGVGVSTLAKFIANKMGSPEFILLPKKKSKGLYVIDADYGHVIIDDIRKLYEQTRTSQPGKSVYIIDTGLSSMTLGAQNAFLKLLEEPRSGLHFIIATHSYDTFLSTVISRCQRLSLLPISEKQSVEFLAKLNVSSGIKRTRLAFIGKGLPALLTKLSQDDNVYNRRVEIMKDAKTILQEGTYKKLVVIESYRNNREEALTLIDDICHQLKVAIKSSPNQSLAFSISRFIAAKESVAKGCNIRIQLTAAVL